MHPKVHEIKSWPEFFRAIEDQDKTADLRRSDRDFQVGDYVLFREFDPHEAKHHDPDRGDTGASCLVKITHITEPADNVGVPGGFVMLSIAYLDSQG